MFTDLASIRTAVKERLTPELPSKWKWETSIDGTIKATTPVVYLEFTNFDNTVLGQELGHGQVAAGFNLIVTDPKTDTTKAEDSVDEHVLRVIRAIDPEDDLYWSNALKRRLDDGPLAWSVSLIAITETPAPTEE